jgi:hypothetical protein
MGRAQEISGSILLMLDQPGDLLVNSFYEHHTHLLHLRRRDCLETRIKPSKRAGHSRGYCLAFPQSRHIINHHQQRPTHRRRRLRDRSCSRLNDGEPTMLRYLRDHPTAFDRDAISFLSGAKDDWWGKISFAVIGVLARTETDRTLSAPPSCSSVGLVSSFCCSTHALTGRWVR